MFSASLELILNVAYREAMSRRHTHLPLEHLLYALAHDTEAERILAACGADLRELFERAGGGRRAGVPGGQDDLERANTRLGVCAVERILA